MARISELYPEYAKLADGLRTGIVPETPENRSAHDRELANMCAHRSTHAPKAPLSQNGWATLPVAAACWAGDALDIERCN